MEPHDFKPQQLGIATIVVTIVILFFATVAATFANRSLIFDIRSSKNETNYREALAMAEAGLDFGSQRFSDLFRNHSNPNANLSTLISNAQVSSWTKADGGVASASDSAFTVTIADTGTLTVNNDHIFRVVATGRCSDPSSGCSASVQHQFAMINALGGDTPNVPVVVGGSVGTGGNFNIVANPNGGNTPGAAVSVWSNNTINLSSSSATCHIQYFSGGQCPNPSTSSNVENISRGTGSGTTLSSYDSTFPDLLPNDPNFPTDLFRFLFGVTRSNWEAKKAEAALYGQVKTDCSALTSAGTDAGKNFPIWWITGPCSLTGGTLGSTDKPVVLVVDDNQLRGAGNTELNGIIYLFDNPSSSTTSPSADLHGTMQINGSFISDTGGSNMNGSYSVKYDPILLSSFTTTGSNFSFSKIRYSWRDFN